MKRVFLLGLCLASSVAYADCMIKSDINLALQKVEFGPTDIQQMVSSNGNGKSCSIRYRVNINEEWQTAEGVGQGATEAEACKQALDLHNGALLTEVEPTKVTANTQLVCSDLENIQIRRVKIGETIWESEVDIHRHPRERRYFDYKQTKCRMFTERNDKDKNLYTYQGVICKITTAPGSKWRVVDKY